MFFVPVARGCFFNFVDFFCFCLNERANNFKWNIVLYGLCSLRNTYRGIHFNHSTNMCLSVWFHFVDGSMEPWAFAFYLLDLNDVFFFGSWLKSSQYNYFKLRKKWHRHGVGYSFFVVFISPMTRHNQNPFSIVLRYAVISVKYDRERSSVFRKKIRRWH